MTDANSLLKEALEQLPGRGNLRRRITQYLARQEDNGTLSAGGAITVEVFRAGDGRIFANVNRGGRNLAHLTAGESYTVPESDASSGAERGKTSSGLGDATGGTRSAREEGYDELRNEIIEECADEIARLTDHKVGIWGWQRAATDAIRALKNAAGLRK